METVNKHLPIKLKTTRKDSWKKTILAWFRLTNDLVVRVYRGYGNARKVTIQGHVLRLSPMPRRKYRKNMLVNLLAVIRLFFVRPVPNVTVRLKGTTLQTLTDADGFFRIEWVPQEPLPPGWHTIKVELITAHRWITEGEGRFYIPPDTQYGCISDIDDTFLVSHSSTIARRLLVLLTENAHSREPFDDVVTHYQLLANACTVDGHTNPFFFVSSSEWNLYDYILEFSETNHLPDGVYLLSQLKRLRQLWKTGKNKHFTKMDRIARILHMYPERKFILLGDDSQEDPAIYASVIAHYPNQIRSVYLRQINKKNQERTKQLIGQMEQAGVSVCYFRHSAKAIEHSQRIGLLP